MAVGVKLLHIVSDNNLIKVVHRFVLSPFRMLRRRKCTDFPSSFHTRKTVLLLTQLHDQSVEYMMSCPNLSAS